MIQRRFGCAETARWRGAIYVAAAGLFVATAWVGFASFPEHRASSQPLLLVAVVLLLAPATTAANAAEYALTARFVGVQVGPARALRIAVLSTAANLLPLPGAVLVRVTALRDEGTRPVGAARVVLAAGTLWVVAAGALLGAFVLASGERPEVGALLLLGAAALIPIAHRMAGAHLRSDGVRTTALLIAFEGAAAALGAGRLWCCAHGLGIELGAGDAVALASASVLAAAIGIAPAGLGVREAIAGAIAPLVGVAAGVGAAISALDRVLGSASVAVAAGAFALGARRRSAPPPDAPEVRRG